MEKVRQVIIIRQRYTASHFILSIINIKCWRNYPINVDSYNPGIWKFRMIPKTVSKVLIKVPQCWGSISHKYRICSRVKSNCEGSAWLILDMKYPLMLEKSPRDRAGGNWAGVDIPDETLLSFWKILCHNLCDLILLCDINTTSGLNIQLTTYHRDTLVDWHSAVRLGPSTRLSWAKPHSSTSRSRSKLK